MLVKALLILTFLFPSSLLVAKQRVGYIKFKEAIQLKKIYRSRIPTMAMTKVLSSSCHPYYLDKALEKAEDNISYINLLKSYFHRCDKEFKSPLNNSYTNLAKSILHKYNVFGNRHTQKLNLKNNINVKGYLSLKPNKKRPLIIVKCGVFCDGDSRAIETPITAALYDSGPFHLLMVESHTSDRNIATNKRVNLGGLIEGQELIEVADWAKNKSDFKSLISEIHVLGISLGGHAALYAGIYNDHLPKKLIHSVVGHCPVVNIENSISDLTTEINGRYLIGSHIEKLVIDNYEQIPELQTHFNLNDNFNIYKLADKLAKVNVDYIKRLNPNTFLAPFKNIDIQTAKDFYFYSNYLNFINKIKTPTLVWASKNDPFVLNKRNSALIEQALPYPTDKQNLQVLNVKRGSHCAIYQAYDWYTMSKVLVNYFVKNSPSLKKINNLTKINFRQPRAQLGETYMGQTFYALPKSNKVFLEYRFYNGSAYKDPSYATSSDFRTVTVKINKDQLPFIESTPQNNTEARILTRWLNTNVHLVRGDKFLVNSTKEPSHFEWASY